jgi:hypothetical protein
LYIVFHTFPQFARLSSDEIASPNPPTIAQTRGRLCDSPKSFYFFQISFLSPIALHQDLQQCAFLCGAMSYVKLKIVFPLLTKYVAAKLPIPNEILPDCFGKILQEEVMDLPTYELIQHF